MRRALFRKHAAGQSVISVGNRRDVCGCVLFPQRLKRSFSSFAGRLPRLSRLRLPFGFSIKVSTPSP